MIYGRENTDVRVRAMTAQKQPPYYNLCGHLVCRFMADLVEGRSPENVLYCKEEEQRGGCFLFSRVTNLKLVQRKDLVDDPRTLWCQRIKISLLLLALPLVYPKAQKDALVT